MHSSTKPTGCGPFPEQQQNLKKIRGELRVTAVSSVSYSKAWAEQDVLWVSDTGVEILPGSPCDWDNS